MSTKSRSKKRRKGKRAAQPEETSRQHGIDVDPLAELVGEGGGEPDNLHALKIQFLGPFLFGQPSLCEKALQLAREGHLLPPDSGVWPMFCEMSQWKLVELAIKVIATTIKLCETNQSFREYTMDPRRTGLLQDSRSLAEVVQLHSSEGLPECPLQEVEKVFKVVRAQAVHFASRGDGTKAGEAFRQGVKDKEALVAPVKERGNTNFREGRYRAAIADYSRAIKLCPYSGVLYCNRALCYQKNGDSWCACVDSYRAMVLQPGWEKAYYRCAEAWARLGEGPAAMAVNQWGQRQCSDHSDLEKQSRELHTSKSKGADSPPLVVKESDGASSIKKKSDGASSIKKDSDGARSIKKDSDGASSIKKDSDGASSIKKDSDGAHSIKKDSDGASSIKKDSDGASSIKKDSDGASSIKKDSDGASSIKKELDGASSINKDSDGASSIKKDSDGASSIKKDSDGASSIKKDSDGASSIKKDSDGASSIKKDSDGSSSIKKDSDGASSIKKDSDGASSIKKDSDGASSIKKELDGASSTKKELDGASSTKKESNGSSSTKKKASKAAPSKTEPPPARHTPETKAKKTSDKKGTDKKGVDKAGGKSAPSSDPTGIAAAPKTPPAPFTDFEALCYPEVSWTVATETLRHYCSEVKLQYLTPHTYTSHSSQWERLEPPSRPTPHPRTDPSKVTEPKSATFDEIWCPLLADCEDSKTIIPPTFQYLPGGEVRMTSMSENIPKSFFDKYLYHDDNLA